MATEKLGNINEYTVTELSGAIKRSLEDGFGYVRVRGELGRVTKPASGHLYFDMKDDRAVLSGVMWKGMAARMSIRPEQGMEVIASGRLSTFPGQSRYQIIVDTLEPAGVGALMALLEERKKKLAAEGLFDDSRKKDIPFLPEVIGVVTSPSGAVIRDILHRLRERFPRHVLVWPTVVQGKGAEKSIAAAIRGFNSLPAGGAVPRPDVLIVARGGGSLEDLWCFNEEEVVRAAAESQIPLISAVGHETDTTLIDYAADRRAPTPTAAAEMAVPVRSELLSETYNKARRMVAGQSRVIERSRAGFLSASRGLGRPEDILAMSIQRLDRAGDRLAAGLAAARGQAETRFARSASRLNPKTLGMRADRNRDRLTGLGGLLAQNLRTYLREQGNGLASFRLSPVSVRRQVIWGQDRLQNAARRFSLMPAETTRNAHAKLASLSSLMKALSHESILERGFALVKDDDGNLIRRADGAVEGAAGAIRFADGARAVTFGKGVDGPAKAPPSGGATPDTKPKAKRIDAPKSASPVQKSLFDTA